MSIHRSVTTNALRTIVSSRRHRQPGRQMSTSTEHIATGVTYASPYDSRVQVSRVMGPDDANPLGNIHGGIILQMIAEAGYICATKYCNSEESRKIPGNEACSAALARAERTDFLQPMYVGEFAKVTAEVTYVSNQSLEVQVLVYAENIMEGQQRLTNKAHLWYVPESIDDFPTSKTMKVPPLVYNSPEAEKQGRLRYERQKADRAREKAMKQSPVDSKFSNFRAETEEPYTVPFSQSMLAHFVVSSDCSLNGYVRGGITMKLMDEVAGMAAIKHCIAPTVTASVDPINFYKKIRQSGVINIMAQPTFTSGKTIEVHAFVDVQYLDLEKRQFYRERACDAYFTFVALSLDNMSPQEVPPLKLLTAEEEERFKMGEQRYKARRELRQKEKSQNI
ncbi:putative cytosolic acyl coenzyme A thioester hydrolase-like [Glandiceps talaboti]